MRSSERGGRAGYRARMVCIRCHDRKVRCDLQDQPGGKCRNCQRDDQECRQRFGVRKKSGVSKEILHAPSSQTANETASQTQQQSPISAAACDIPDQMISPNSPSQVPSGYIGDQSVLSYPSDLQTAYTPSIGALSMNTTDTILQITKANVVPPVRLLQASTDLYFQHLFCSMPVLDREDLNQSEQSLLLQQLLHFSGSLMRRSKDYPTSPSLQDTYTKIRTLIFLNHEPNKLIVLKTLCILGCWSPNIPDVITMNSAWHWTGMAVRLALQMGLHRESTYINNVNGGCSRRLWWCLFNIDTVQSASYGRPPMIHREDFDVKIPALKDFSVPDAQAHAFIRLTLLCNIVSDIQVLSARRQDIALEDILKSLTSLHRWLEEMPEEFRLYQNGQRNSYNRPVLELHILYFVSIIWLYLLPGDHRNSPLLCTASIVASSCITRLYEEIIYHEDVAYLLPHHSWINLVAAIPQVYSIAKFPAQEAICVEELELCSTVLSQMSEKYPSAGIVLGKMTRFRQDGSNLSRLITPSASVVSSADAPQPHNPDEPFANISAMFPFPDSICPRMTFLRPAEGTVSGVVESGISPFSLQDLDWKLDWSTVSLDNSNNLGDLFTQMPDL